MLESLPVRCRHQRIVANCLLACRALIARHHSDQHHADLQLVEGDYGGTLDVISRAREILLDPFQQKQLNTMLSKGQHAK